MSGYNWGKPGVSINAAVDRLLSRSAICVGGLSKDKTYVVEYDGLITEKDRENIQRALDNTGHNFILLGNGMTLSEVHKCRCADDTKGLTRVNVRTEGTSDANREGEV
jgi:hypothetical protein